MYQFKTTQKLNISINEAWNFLSNPKNLKDITPEYMRFDIVSGDDKKMFPGQIIEYILTPVFNIPFKWVTEITHVKQKKYFVDEQRFGPYSFWHHKHFIKEVEDGVIMEDIVHYKLPLGIIGRIAHRFFVRNKVEEIFSYRRKKLDSLFNN